MPAEITVGGLARLSACDWPGQLVATIFCQGCPWRCPYCHNPHLLAADTPAAVLWAEVTAFLDRRRGLLDGVVFSGGEPTLQAGLADAVEQLKAMGFRVGLHSAGPYPERFAAILPRLDWVGFDVKAPFVAYDRLTGVTGSGARARASLEALLASGVAFELRTTVHPALLDDEALARLHRDLADLGAPAPTIQPFRATGCTESSFLNF